MEKLWTSDKLAEYLDVPVQSVYVYAREGLLPHVRIGRKIRFSQKAIEEFILQGGRALPGGWRKDSKE